MSESLEDVYNIYKADETWELGSIPAAVSCLVYPHRTPAGNRAYLEKNKHRGAQAMNQLFIKKNFITRAI